jgi:hypothetical protein
MFFLVWDKDSYTEIPSFASMHMYVTIHIHSSLPDLFTTSWSPFHSGLCQFNTTLLLYSKHINHIQVLGLLSFPYSSRACPPFSVTHV